MPITNTHAVKKEDQQRIPCGGKFGECQKPATVCHHVEWNTGNTKGISFFYYCDECAVVATERDKQCRLSE